MRVWMDGSKLMHGTVEVLGVTMGWSGGPVRELRWPDRFVGVMHGDRRLYPEWYGEDGWPINPLTGERLKIHRNSQKVAHRPMTRRIWRFIRRVWRGR